MNVYEKKRMYLTFGPLGSSSIVDGDGATNPLDSESHVDSMHHISDQRTKKTGFVAHAKIEEREA